MGKNAVLEEKYSDAINFYGLKKDGWSYSKINTSKVLYNDDDTSMVQVNFSRLDKDNEIILTRDYDPSIPEINGDENLFVQAILNIVKNAQQAIENIQNPTIKIKSRIEYSKPINGVVHQTICNIEIIDNGAGIPEELHDQIFFPMVSVKENGSGLGLTIAQDIIRIHGGGIIFKSNPGKTTFAIQIPIRIENKEAKIA